MAASAWRVVEGAKCVVCDRLVRRTLKTAQVDSRVVGEELKRIVSLERASEAERRETLQRWAFVPDDYRIASDDRVCYTCSIISPELVRDARDDETWLGHWRELQAYVKKAKHANCPVDYKVPNSNFRLGVWLSDQRTRKRQRTLFRDRERLLDELGVEWEVRDARSDETWHGHLQELEEYVKDAGHANCPADYRVPGSNFHLGRWLCDQRMEQRREALLPDRVRLLEQLGVVWDVRDALDDETWHGHLKQLEEYVKVHKHANCPAKYEVPGEVPGSKFLLGEWLGKQRRKQREDDLSPDRKRLLEQLGVKWTN